MELTAATTLLPDLEDATIEQVVVATYVLIDKALADDDLAGIADAYRAMQTIMYAYGHPTITLHNRFLIEARIAIDWIEIYEARVQSDAAKFRQLDSNIRTVIVDTTAIIIKAQTAMLHLHQGLPEYGQQVRVIADSRRNIEIEVTKLEDLGRKNMQLLEDHVALRLSYVDGMVKHRTDMQRFALRLV